VAVEVGAQVSVSDRVSIPGVKVRRVNSEVTVVSLPFLGWSVRHEGRSLNHDFWSRGCKQLMIINVFIIIIVGEIIIGPISSNEIIVISRVKTDHPRI
jgi:hypothetical protein